MKATENLGGRSAAKIRDIATVFARYEKFLSENGLTDSNNALSGISEAVKNDETLKNAAVVFIGFSSITRQTAEAIDEISKAAKSADYFAVKGENEDLFVKLVSLASDGDPAVFLSAVSSVATSVSIFFTAIAIPSFERYFLSVFGNGRSGKTFRRTFRPDRIFEKR
mgnify:CR=1 FL=1